MREAVHVSNRYNDVPARCQALLALLAGGDVPANKTDVVLALKGV